MKKYVIYDIRFNQYFTDIVSYDFTDQIIAANFYGDKKEAKEQIKKLKPGVYEIKEIYYID